MEDESALRERLESFAGSLDGLLSITPAHLYSERDNSDQWKKKKQTPEEKRAARKAKLDPKNIRTAKDVMFERELKRKRELEEENSKDGQRSHISNEGASDEPGLAGKQIQKKQKTDDSFSQDHRTDEEVRRLKKERKQAKKARQKEQVHLRHGYDRQARREMKAKARKRASGAEEGDIHHDQETDRSHAALTQSRTLAKADAVSVKRDKQQKVIPKVSSSVETTRSHLALQTSSTPFAAHDEAFESNEAANDDIECGAEQPADVQNEKSSASTSAQIDVTEVGALDVADDSVVNSPALDSSFSEQQESSSKSSVDEIAPSSAPAKTRKPKLSAEEHERARARLEARIAALRAARKADGPDGKPARSRSELLEARRKRAEKQRENKKELRKAAKDEELRLKTEAELAKLRGSGSPMGSDIFSPLTSGGHSPAYAFGRIKFDDGQEIDIHGNVIAKPKQKGPSDPRTALAAANNKAARLAGLDSIKKDDIQSKDAWLNAKKRAHGERVREDTSLLKKALKRKEKQKSKSEREWHEREEGVRKAQERRQQKREENLQKRKDEKKSGPNKYKKAKRKAFGSMGRKKKA